MPSDRGLCGHIKAWWDNHPKCLFCSSCSRLSSCSICNLWSQKIWDLADKRRLYSARRPTMKKLAKKKKIVHSDASDNNSFLEGSTTSQSLTAGGKTHLGGNYMGARGTQSISPPDTGHQAPVSFTRHWSIRHQTTRHRSNRHWATYHSQPGTGLPGTRQSILGQPGAGQPVTGHLISGTSHQLPVIRALVIKQ